MSLCFCWTTGGQEQALDPQINKITCRFSDHSGTSGRFTVHDGVGSLESPCWRDRPFAQNKICFFNSMDQSQQNDSLITLNDANIEPAKSGRKARREVGGTRKSGGLVAIGQALIMEAREILKSMMPRHSRRTIHLVRQGNKCARLAIREKIWEMCKDM